MSAEPPAPAAPSPSDSPAGGESFAGELRNLERVVHLLESGELDLEEAIRHYESGHGSLKRCCQILEQAQKRIEILAAEAGSEALFIPLEPAGASAGTEGS